MNDIIEKVKTAFFGKDGEKKPPYIVVVGAIGVIGLLVYNNVFKKEGDANIKDKPTVSSESPQGLGSLIGEENYEKIRASELAKSQENNKDNGNMKMDNNTVNDTKPVQPQPIQIQQTQSPMPPIVSLDDRLKIEEALKEKKDLEKERIRMEAEEKKKEELLKRKVALTYIGYSVSYPDEVKQENVKQEEEVSADRKLSSKEVKESSSNFLITTKGELLDDIKLRVGANKTVRIKLDNGDILVVKAIATNTGIVFDNKGIINGENVNIQVEDMEGNMEMVSYVIDNSNKRISKSAFLSFIKGFSEGMVKRTQQTSALGTTTEFINSGIQTGLGKGIAGATDSLIQENQRNIIPDIMVLLSGERLKVMIIKTKEV